MTSIYTVVCVMVVGGAGVVCENSVVLLLSPIIGQLVKV